tara:strand:- start:443 stop:613 length:171 start_codon:yes stop_codon:yes gene_type:complete
MKEYICEVNLVFSGNNLEAKNKNEYVKKVKDTFKDEFNIELDDKEISNIQLRKEYK